MCDPISPEAGRQANIEFLELLQRVDAETYLRDKVVSMGARLTSILDSYREERETKAPFPNLLSWRVLFLTELSIRDFGKTIEDTMSGNKTAGLCRFELAEYKKLVFNAEKNKLSSLIAFVFDSAFLGGHVFKHATEQTKLDSEVAIQKIINSRRLLRFGGVDLDHVNTVKTILNSDFPEGTFLEVANDGTYDFSKDAIEVLDRYKSVEIGGCPASRVKRNNGRTDYMSWGWGQVQATLFTPDVYVDPQALTLHEKGLTMEMLDLADFK